MRSRFSAFVRGEHAYLFRTLHPDHDDHAAGERALRAELARGARRNRYDTLVVIDRDGPDADGIARVLFHVTMRRDGRDASFAELSSFAHDGTGWRYVAGVSRSCRASGAAGLTIGEFARGPS